MHAKIILTLSLLAAPAAQAAPVIQLLGKGVQIYVCAPANPGFAWRLKAPEAILTDTTGAAAGRHFAGPTWQAADGSTVTGKPLVASPAPQPGAIPWLVLQAAAHGGSGVFTDVAYIVRSLTEGGAAPASGCDAAHAGALVRVGYQATYLFFPAPR